MSFQPLLPWWLLVLVALALGGLSVWQLLSANTNRVGWARRCGIIALMTLIGFGPSIEERVPDGLLSNAEVYFVVDRTGSMAAQDHGTDGETRLSGVKTDIDHLTRIIPGAQFSVIAFDSQASQQLPLTSDARAVRTLADTMRQEITSYSAGSAVDRPLEILHTTLARAEERNPENVRLVFLFADGENTKGSLSDPTDVESYAPLAPLVDGGAVLGYGTEEGGRMLRYTGTWPPKDDDWIVDPATGEPAISTLDEGQLRQVADDLGISYIHRVDDSSLESVIEGIDIETLASDGRRDTVVHTGVYWVGALALGLVLAWEMWDVARQFPTRGGLTTSGSHREQVSS